MAAVVHKTIHGVEKVIPRCPQTVDKTRPLCYNEAMRPDFTALDALISENGEKFARFYEMLISCNAKYNLTAIKDEKEVRVKHFLDSLAGEELFFKGASVVEVGSGGGFPSVPLMLVRGDLHFTLVESTGKKCDFLRAVVKEFGLNATIKNARAEDCGRDPSLRERYDICIARAVARLNTLSEYCLPLVKKGGFFLAYKGNADEEIFEAKNAITLLGGGKTEAFPYELPEGYGSRTLVRIQKQKNTPEKYPRGQGRERSKPL